MCMLFSMLEQNTFFTLSVLLTIVVMYPPHIIPNDEPIRCSQCRCQRRKRRGVERLMVRLRKHIDAKDKEMKSLNKWIDILEAKLRIMKKQLPKGTAVTLEEGNPK